MMVFLLNLSLMALWVASTGVFSYANSALGFLVGFVVLWWLQPLLGPTTYFRKLPLALRFSVLFLWEVLKSNLRVAWDVITPNRRRRPGIVAVPLDAKSDLEIAVLANLITLTPGSLCLDVSEDRRTLYVHAMFVSEPDQVRREIKQRFESWILALLR
jgi:multicomponent Na+:H+ antiporter subunit E